VTDIDAIVPASADEADRAAFPSVEAALRFAFGHRRGQPDSLAKHQKREAGLELGTQFDRPAGGER
jgi:hypothetical protein